MLEPIMHILKAERIVLASSSPRRKEVLQNIGLNFEVVASLYEEEKMNPCDFPDPASFVTALALGKAQEVSSRLSSVGPPADLVVGADTVVVFQSQILGKPKDKEHAREMLTSFSGRSHFVYTGIALISSNNKTVQFHEKTEVTMGELSPEVISAYIATGEPMDKAGGYGIQSVGGTLVKSVVGDYFNIVGFPLYSFCTALVQLYTPQNK